MPNETEIIGYLPIQGVLPRAVHKKVRTRAQGDTTNLMYYLPRDEYFVAYTRYAGCSFLNTREFLNELDKLKQKPEACTFYEVILKDFPVYEFYDLDDKDFGDQTVEKYLDWFLEQRKIFKDNFSRDNIRIKRAMGKKKSIHSIRHITKKKKREH